jgi:DNA primase
VATRWIDFNELKRRVPIRDVLARYGFLEKLQEKKPGKLVGACPIHGGSNRTSFHADTGKNVFHCFSQCGGGNVLDMVMKIEDCTIREAGEKLADWFDLAFERRKEEEPKPASRPTPGSKATTAHAKERLNPPLERPLASLNPDHPYLVERGLTVPTIKEFGLGYCTRGIMRGRIAIPIHDEEGELIAYAGRAGDDALSDEKGKYRLPDGFHKAHVLYNMHRAREHAANGLIIVEGFFGAMRVCQAGFPGVVALMGSSLSEHQEELLVETTERLTLLLDGDEAGRACRRDIWKRLSSRLWLRNIPLEDGQQPDDLPQDQLRQLLS